MPKPSTVACNRPIGPRIALINGLVHLSSLRPPLKAEGKLQISNFSGGLSLLPSYLLMNGTYYINSDGQRNRFSFKIDRHFGGILAW